MRIENFLKNLSHEELIEVRNMADNLIAEQKLKKYKFTQMKDYFKRLKDHPGLGIATALTFMGALAGAQNKSFENPLNGALFGVAVIGVFVWSVVLISNRK